MESLRRADHLEGTCDDCWYQEGRHYCLLWSMSVKNMDIVRCEDFKEKEYNDG